MVRDEPMLPRAFRVVKTTRESRDVVTLSLEQADDGPQVRCEPGQFCMLYAFGVGEVPISLSGDPRSKCLTHTVRRVGAVTRALCDATAGETVGIRGPFGRPWPVRRACGGDLVLIAGGIGLAPLRPVVLEALTARERFGRVIVLYGARSPEERIFTDALAAWADSGDVEILTTVDIAGDEWHGCVGVVPALVRSANLDPGATTALICGPEVMIRFSHQALRQEGVVDDRIYVSLERNMACAVRLCGRCQLGPEFVCADGPVFPYARVAGLLAVPEL